jgi:hypothetical protein
MSLLPLTEPLHGCQDVLPLSHTASLICHTLYTFCAMAEMSKHRTINQLRNKLPIY